MMKSSLMTLKPSGTRFGPLRLGGLALLAASVLSACGPASDEVALGLEFAFAPSAAVPPEQIAAFEVGVIRSLPNNDCQPFSSRPITDGSLTCPDTAANAQLLELRDDEGHATKKLRFSPNLSGTGRQSLSLRVPVGASTSILIQAKDAEDRLLGSGCAYVGRVSISSVEFDSPTAELNLDESYTSCQPILP